jgi:hypothetical protein
MKTKSTQQEILLVTGTSFSSRQWCKNDDAGQSENLTDQEKLQEMLPEICDPVAGTEKLFVWQIRQASSFLELELGSFPEEKDNYFSIDPYSFIATRSDN